MAISASEFTELLELNTLILNSVGDGVYGINKDGRTTFSNPAAERMTGWSIADLQGQESHSVWHHTKPDGSHYPKEDCPIYAALQDGVVHHEQDELFWRKDGSSFNVEYTSTPMIRDGKIVGAVVVFRDISHRKLQEKKLTDALCEVKRLQALAQAENAYLKDELMKSGNFNNIVGEHPTMQKLLNEVTQVAPTDASVLISGETGTGKELIARAIHQNSLRKDGPLIKINCGAIPSNLVESELFGHEKGAFTGALNTRVGRFELADGGTLFLDEVAELSKDVQTKLLRVLQEGEFERVGSNTTIKVDVRIISASHKNLKNMCDEDLFRPDLYYRLSVFPLKIPALRERLSDFPMLVDSIIASLAKKLNKPLTGVSEESLQHMLSYPWYGNVRELQNVLERSAILSQSAILNIDKKVLSSSALQESDDAQPSSNQTLSEVEKQHILNTIERTKWKISGPGGAADLLGMHPNTLRARMDKLGIKKST